MIGVAVLGSTGSVGASTLDVLARHPQRFRLVAVAAHRNAARLAQQIIDWQPAYAALSDDSVAHELVALLAGRAPRTRVLAGPGALEEIAALAEVGVRDGRDRRRCGIALDARRGARRQAAAARQQGVDGDGRTAAAAGGALGGRDLAADRQRAQRDLPVPAGGGRAPAWHRRA